MASKTTRSNSASTATNVIDESTLESVINKLAPKLIGKIEEQLDKLGKQIEKMDSTMNNIVAKLDSLDKLAHSNQEEVQSLRRKVDFLEQRNRLNTLRLVGMKEESNENITANVLLLFNEGLEIKCTVEDINNIYRIGKYIESKQIPRTVIVDFVSYWKRNEIYKVRAKQKGTGIYMNEDLTGKQYHILTSARKKLGAQNVWTKNGRIFSKVGNEVKTINETADLT